MKSALPKVLHPVAGRPMVAHVLAGAQAVGADPAVTVIGPGHASVADAVAPCPTVVQTDRLGTGHAVLQARDALAGYAGTVLILYGDTPLIRAETLAAMLEARTGAGDPAVVVLGFTPADPGPYGRLITAADGALERIVEAKDATPEELAVGLCNSGVMAVDGSVLFDLLDRVGNDNAKGEYYLTDLVALARAAGRTCAVVTGDPQELLGVNSRAELAVAEAALQDRLRAAAMAGGATLIDPASTFFSADTVLGADVTVGPFCVFGPGVIVESGADIKGFCHLEGAVVKSGARIGPYARLRPGAEIGEDAHIGNFVEVKNSSLAQGAKANHLAYVGDATVGAGANIGAGTITANYDGYFKHRTEIGAGANTGSNSVLVAPVTLGADAMTGAGTVVRSNVPAGALVTNGTDQQVKEGWATRYRAAKKALKDKLSRKKDA